MKAIWHINLSPEQSEIIRQFIDGFVDRPPEILNWQSPYVREYVALPLYSGWTETIGITQNGDVVKWCTDTGILFIDSVETQFV